LDFVYIAKHKKIIDEGGSKMYGNLTTGDTDETLIESTLYGDNDAFNQLVLRYQRTVFSAAFSVLKNVHLAEDIAQDAFLAAWQKLNTLNIFKKATNLCLNIRFASSKI
jgi:hypothetical protein